ncbi:hypothetical protein [Sorangium sp. So ce362]|uniref:hypothetical protein n=1 Tax=Sorangium sp. So ce362 TaxID=3133303 RepID=UPI003F5E3F0E
MYLSSTFFATLKELWLQRGVRRLGGSEVVAHERSLVESLIGQLNRAAERALDERAAPCRPDFVQEVVAPLVHNVEPSEYRPLLRYLGRHLLRLMPAGALDGFEWAMTQCHWALIFDGAEYGDYQAFLELDSTNPCVLALALAGAIDSILARDPDHAETKTMLERTLSIAKRLFPLALKHRCNVSQPLFDLVVRTALAAPDFDEHASTWRDALVGWATAKTTGHSKLDSEVLEQLLNRCIETGVAGAIVDSLTCPALASLARQAPRLARHLIHHQPDRVAQRVARAWREASDLRSGLSHDVRDVLLLDYARLSQFLSAELAYEYALIVHGNREELNTPEDVSAPLLALLGVRDSGTNPALLRRARAWTYLLRYAWYGSQRGERRTERRGFEEAITSFALKSPEDWAAMIPMLLTRNAEIQQLVESVTLLVAAASRPVREALRDCRSSPDEQALRDRARGMLATVEGLDTADQALSGHILSRLARCVDGRPAFPHPLDVRASTWLCSLPAEATIRTRVKAAVSSFCGQLNDQLGAMEEVLTERLASAIKNSLNSAAVTVSAVGSSRSTRGASITIEDRQTTKSEETEHGADLAIVVNVSVPGAFLFRSAELIQCKKPAREGGAGTQFIDAYDIDVQQIRTITSVSQTAVYWLFGRYGELLVVPARLLFAIIAGSGRERQGAARVHYADVRSMSIPLQQFLVDLFMGGWIGSSTERALSVANGDDPYLRPRRILEVTMKVDTLDAPRT